MSAYNSGSGRIPPNAEPGEYSVAQFFPDGTNEYVRRWVSAEEAFKAFKHYTTSVGARLGTTTEVMITDGGDYCNVHWVYGKGIVYPTKEQVAEALKTQQEMDNLAAAFPPKAKE